MPNQFPPGSETGLPGCRALLSPIQENLRQGSGGQSI
jgi:hypothetical protein